MFWSWFFQLIWQSVPHKRPNEGGAQVEQTCNGLTLMTMAITDSSACRRHRCLCSGQCRIKKTPLKKGRKHRQRERLEANTVKLERLCVTDRATITNDTARGHPISTKFLGVDANNLQLRTVDFTSCLLVPEFRHCNKWGCEKCPRTFSGHS